MAYVAWQTTILSLLGDCLVNDSCFGARSYDIIPVVVLVVRIKFTRL